MERQFLERRLGACEQGEVPPDDYEQLHDCGVTSR